MPLDGISVLCLQKELSSALSGASVQKIFQPEKEMLILHMKVDKEIKKLLVCAAGSAARCQLTKKTPDNPTDAPMFCMLMRKHLLNARLVDIESAWPERLLRFVFSVRNELGDLTTRTMVVEMMGKYSNIILTDENSRIIDAVHRVDMTVSSKRLVLPGLFYENPPGQDKQDPLSFSGVLPPETTARYLTDTFSGLSPLAAREFLREEGGFTRAVAAILARRFSPCVIFDKESKKPLDFWSMPIKEYQGIADRTDTATLSEAMELFYGERERRAHLAAKAAQTYKTVKTTLERTEKKLALQQEKLSEAKDAHKILEKAELINANLYRIHEGDTTIEVIDYYREDTPTVTIQLDPRLSPAQNAQKLFKRYRKLKTAGEYARTQIEAYRVEIEYLGDILRMLDDAEDETVISEIRTELTEQGYIRAQAVKRKKAQSSKVPQPAVREIDGITVYIGRNNLQNEYVTFKLGRANDVWLHVKDRPGSHVLIKCPLQSLPDHVLEAAAALAAQYSDAHGAPKTAVDYTLVKYVKKQPAGKPGMVLYTDFYTIYT